MEEEEKEEGKKGVWLFGGGGRGGKRGVQALFSSSHPFYGSSHLL